MILKITKRLLFMLFVLLLASGCSETVGFLVVKLQVATRELPIICSDDPRRASSLTIKVTCEEGSAEATYGVQAGVVSLSDVPLGNCTLEVTASNKHGRVVLTSKPVATTIASGENEPVKIELKEPACSELATACDTDGDGLADYDEKKMGTSSSLADSDGDGLWDGVEVMECCEGTDPAVKDGANCKLLIQSVMPTLAPASQWVLVTTTTTLKTPQVVLGGAAMEGVLEADNVAFGKVGKGAVLGEVKLTSNKETATYRELFAVLQSDPEMILDIDQKAGAKLGLMQAVVDLAYQGSTLLLLGWAGSASANAVYPILTAIDRVGGKYERLSVLSKGHPVALAPGKKRLVVLLGDKIGPSELVIYEKDTGVKWRVVSTITLKATQPVDLALEPDDGGVLVLFRDSLVRLDMSGSTLTPSSDSLSFKGLLGTAPSGSTSMQASGCTGLAYHEPTGSKPGEGTAYLACNVTPAQCPAGASCEQRPVLLRLKPAGSCLAQASRSGKPLSDSKSCWTAFASLLPHRSLGAPVVDAVAQQVYLLTTAGVMVPQGLASAKPGLGALALHLSLPTRWRGTTTSTRVMTLDPGGYLYVADGPQVWRMEPRPRRRGTPFTVGQAKEEALAVTLSADGSTLEVGRMLSGLQSLAAVCLKRCLACPCK